MAWRTTDSARTRRENFDFHTARDAHVLLVSLKLGLDGGSDIAAALERFI